MIIEAKKLRDKDILQTISDDRPGYYNWWAPYDALDILLKELDIKFEDISPYMEKKNDLYSIYVGIAVKESLRKRLNWHVNQKHSETAVVSGTLSTLRQTISSVVAHDQYNEEKTNEFIDMLIIEYFEEPNEIKSLEAKQQIHNIERELLASHLRILNIQENNHPKAIDIKKKLKAIRKGSK